MSAYDDLDDGSEPELIRPEDFLAPDPFPADARRLGIDRYTGDSAAVIALAASLDARKSSHRLVAWLMLVVFGAPVVLALLNVFR